MRICIYGAGAIGGYLGASLALADNDVTLIARGPHLEAMRKDGIRLLKDGEERVARPVCTDDPGEVGVHDYVFVAVKAPSIPSILEPMQSLIGPETAVVTATNGIPWWYFHRLEGPWENHRLESVDPGGEQWNRIGPERVIGCVVYPAAEVPSPGVIRHIEGDRFTLGEPSGDKTDRVLELSRILADADLRAPVRPIRDEIWLKLWGNLSLNPISALTLATLDVIATDPRTRATATAMMLEARRIGEKLGVRFPREHRASTRRRRRRGSSPHLHAAGPRSRSTDGDRRARYVRPGVRPVGRCADPDHRHGPGAAAATRTRRRNLRLRKDTACGSSIQ